MTSAVRLVPTQPRLQLRLPSAERGAWESELASAWTRGRDDATRALDRMLPGIEFEERAQSADGATFRRSLAPTPVRQWFDPEAMVERLFTLQDLGEGRLKIVRDGVEVDPRSVLDRLRPDASAEVIAPSRLALALDDGHTLVLDGTDRRDVEVRRLAEMFARVFLSRVNINGYLSYRPHDSFGTHWDDHEVVILQLLGRKDWRVFEPTALSPHANLHHQKEDFGPLVWEGQIESGGYLYLPRGWAHQVTGTHELTFHLTITVPRLSVFRLLDLSLQARNDPRVLDAVLPGDEVGPKIDEFDRLLTPDDDHLDRALAVHRANIAGFSTQTPRSVVSVLTGQRPRSDVWLRFPYAGGCAVSSSMEEEPFLVFGGRTVQLDDRAAGTLAPLLDGRVHRASAVEERSGDAPGAREDLDAAVRAGLLEVVDDPDDPMLALTTD